MLFNLLNIALFIGCFILASALHSAAKKNYFSRFGRVDYWFSLLIYLVAVERLMSILQWQTVGQLIMGFQLFVCFRLITLMRQVMPEVFDSPINKVLFEPRTREEIYEQVQREKAVILAVK